MKVVLFDHDWHNEIISQTQSGFSEDISPEGHAIATAIMIAGCCIAQAIDHAVDPEGDNSIADAIHSVAGFTERVAEAAEEMSEAG